jgi:Tat protein translocase TatB subunit
LQASSIGAGIEGWPIHRRPEDVWRDRIVFDLAWSEMAIILVVALVVVGPKDLPRLARTLGQWIAKGRSMAREFQRHIDDMAREADLADLKDSVQKISPSGIRREIAGKPAVPAAAAFCASHGRGAACRGGGGDAARSGAGPDRRCSCRRRTGAQVHARTRRESLDGVHQGHRRPRDAAARPSG